MLQRGQVSPRGQLSPLLLSCLLRRANHLRTCPSMLGVPVSVRGPPPPDGFPVSVRVIAAACKATPYPTQHGSKSSPSSSRMCQKAHRDQPHHVSGPEAGRMFVQDLAHCTMEFDNKIKGQEVQTLLSKHVRPSVAPSWCASLPCSPLVGPRPPPRPPAPKHPWHPPGGHPCPVPP